uniref:Thioredoxin domain-containing protein n=1 Tax=Elaeophora elaphi TaxID=1147741 RepID=A0A0R3S391_9BILA
MDMIPMCLGIIIIRHFIMTATTIEISTMIPVLIEMAFTYPADCSDYDQQRINLCANMLTKLDAFQQTAGLLEKLTMWNVFKKSRDELLNICDAYNQYKECISDSLMKEKCYSREPFRSRYATTDNSLSYACGEAYPFLYTSWHCIQKVATDITYMECINIVRAGEKMDYYQLLPNLLSPCRNLFSNLEAYVYCIRPAIENRCGRHAYLAVLMTIRRSSETLFPYCTLNATWGHVMELTYVMFVSLRKVGRQIGSLAKLFLMVGCRHGNGKHNFSGAAECINALAAKENIDQRLFVGVGGDKWAEKFCRKFIDNLNMRSVIASLVLSILLLNFDAFCNSNGQLNQRESAPPRPFFQPSSKKYLVDYYTGNNAEPENLLYNSEIVVVMYYAPWSRRCIRTRAVFENVARSLSASSDISFAAVNCFFPHGECKKSHKTYTYPVIVAYIGKQSLMYTGLLASDYIYRWISRLRNPIHRLITPSAMKSFVDEFDNAVIAFFHAEVAFAISYEFQQYIKAALIVFQHQDLFDKVGFAVVTNPSLAMNVNLSSKAWIQMRSWKRIYNYDESNVTAYKIFEWVKIQALKSNGLQWISSEMNGVAKSEELLSVLQRGATVVVFVDRQVLYPHSWTVSVVKQTIMEYYACGADLTNQMKSRSNKLDALVNERNQIITMSGYKCGKISARTMEIRKCCLTEKTSLMSRCFQCRSKEGMNFSESESCSPLFFYNAYPPLFHNVPCLSILSTLSEEQLMNNCCELLISKNQSLDISESTFEQCAKYRLARNLYRHISDSPPSTYYPFDATSAAGLSCSKNNSLRFIGVDGRYDDYILNRLRKSFNGQTIALIVDPSTERTFLMQAEFSRNTFRDFLRAFHDGSLVPHVISQTLQKESENLVHVDLSVLPSINAESFKTDVNSFEDTVVFFSGGNWHGPSASIIHVYHSVAHYFHPFLRLIKFYMYDLLIDVSLNDLPWQFQMDTLPAVLFFPAGRKSSSSRFPALVPLTVPNLIAFIVTRCQRELRWQLALSFCSPLCIKKNSLRLQKIAITLKNDIALLRRSEQLYSTRRLLKAMSMSKFS